MNRVWLGLLLILFIVGTINCLSPETVANIDQGVDTAEGVLTNPIVKGIADKIPWAGTTVTSLLALLGFYRKWRGDKKIAAIVEGVENVKNKVVEMAKDWKEKKELPKFADVEKVINSALGTKATAHNLYNEIKVDVQKYKYGV